MDACTAVSAQLEYVSAGANQSPFSLVVLPTIRYIVGYCEQNDANNRAEDIFTTDFIYASHGNLIVAQSCSNSPRECRVAGVFLAHQAATVTCIKLVRCALTDDAGSCMQILTAGSEGKWKLWNFQPATPAGKSYRPISLQQIFEQQVNGAITAIGGIYNARSNTCFVAAVDATFQFMLYRNRPCSDETNADDTRENAGFGCLTCITTNHHAVNDVEFTKLSYNDADDSPVSILLACAVANSIVIYGVDALSDSNQQSVLTKLCQLHGHEGWIQHLSFSPTLYNSENKTPYKLLSSASQDSTVRLWRIALQPKATSIDRDDFFESLLEQTISNRFDVSTNKANVRHVCTATYEALLFGHDGWVYSAHWMCSNIENKKLQLVTASLDKTVIIWDDTSSSDAVQDSAASHVWSEVCRLGSVGGNLPGFYGAVPACAGSDIKYVISHSFTGSIQIWSNSSVDAETWQSRVSVGGHSQPVQSICWSPASHDAATVDYLYLLSSGFDQTTRLHGCWQSTSKEGNNFEWHELARPQIHGHDINAVCNVGRNIFACGAEEKVIRLFQAPKNFYQNFSRLTTGRSEVIDAGYADLPDGANVPALGLSNKPVYAAKKRYADVKAGGDAVQFVVCDDDEQSTTPASGRGAELYPEIYFKPLELSKPPSEEDLLQHTLWAEMHKLYGHPNEIFALCSTNLLSNGPVLLASACKANKVDLASIFIWNLQETISVPLSVQRTPPPVIDELEFHTATVTQMQFCPKITDDELLLLSASRDRMWALWSTSVVNNSASKFKLAAASPAGVKGGGHSRIIWCCSWAPCGRFFVTGSRDKTLAVWLLVRPTLSVELQTKLTFPEPLMSVDICVLQSSDDGNATYLIAVGLENGSICLRRAVLSVTPAVKITCDAENIKFSSAALPKSDNMLHNGAAQQLAFAWRKKHKSPVCENCQHKRNNYCSSCNELLLASSGIDHSVRIFSLNASGS